MSYRIYGAEESPYSVKVRSYFRYKGIEHEWIVRSQARIAEFQELAKLPLIPLVATPQGDALQDSTPILERIEAAHPEPSIHPSDPALAFLSALVEELGDEWGNKWMFHLRWKAPADQRSASHRIARTLQPDADDDAIEATAAGIAKRMTGRVWFVGSSPQTAPAIEASFEEAVAQLEAHLGARDYLFGARPSFGDFGLWGQMYELWTDPTPGALLRERAPRTCAWIERMLDPSAAPRDGAHGWEEASALLPTLEPFLARQAGARFLPWSDANARAIASAAEEFTVELDGRSWTQKPQKYHARSLAALRERHAKARGDAALDAVLERTGCLRWLAV
ncbi:MAG: glutathione S-transferase family protein [Myxococcales bacterium]|nr:glutathione S-transferase family protein [Myxococcales bacterium]